MNVTKMLRPPCNILAACALTVVAATCVVSVNTTSATADHTKPAVTQATKEWKPAPSSTKDRVLATKEWKTDPLQTKGR